MSTNRWASALQTNTQQFREAFGALSQAQLNWKPDARTWSIAQNIDHLIVINTSYYPAFEALLAGTYQLSWLARQRWLAAWMGRMILGSVQPDRRRRMKTFPVWEPRASGIPGDIVLRLGQHHEELTQRIATLADGAAQRVVASPANRRIFYPLDTAFDIIVTHEQRHLAQAREVLALLPI